MFAHIARIVVMRMYFMQTNVISDLTDKNEPLCYRYSDAINTGRVVRIHHFKFAPGLKFDIWLRKSVSEYGATFLYFDKSYTSQTCSLYCRY